MSFCCLLAGVSEDLLCGFEIALLTGVCGSCLAKLSRGPSRNLGFVACVPDGRIQTVLCVTVSDLSGFGFVPVGFPDEFLKAYLGIKDIIRAAHFAEPVQDLLPLRPDDNDAFLSFVGGLVVLWAVRPDRFGCVYLRPSQGDCLRRPASCVQHELN